MSRRAIALTVFSLTAIAVVGGCQSYNFNPVGACLVQPGQKQVKVGEVTVADIVFVIDNSGSMGWHQQQVRDSFANFVNKLATFNKDRIAHGLPAIDFHIGMTSTDAVNMQGNFYATGGSPQVLHFDSSLDWAGYDPACPTMTPICQRIAWFKGNVIGLGTAGSGTEKGLEAGRLAMQKVLSGAYGSEFPHVGAKLIMVWVGDEDDCSGFPESANGGSVGGDGCVKEKYLPVDQQRLVRISEFDAFFSGLVAQPGQAPSAQQPFASFGAVFMEAAAQCKDSAGLPGEYVPADSSACGALTTAPYNCPSMSPPGTAPTCGICPANPYCPYGVQLAARSYDYAAAVRFFALADSLAKAHGFPVVKRSISDDMGVVLGQVADLVGAPSILNLANVPAADEVAVLRIVDGGGYTRKVCTRAETSADRTTAGWWFVACNDTAVPPAVASGPTNCIYINHASTTGDCEAAAGESYSAEYLGQLPVGGCSGATPDPAPSLACAQALGKGAAATAEDAKGWWCYGAAGTKGTCICNPSP
jgi:hypothetical protein